MGKAENASRSKSKSLAVHQKETKLNEKGRSAMHLAVAFLVNQIVNSYYSIQYDPHSVTLLLQHPRSDPSYVVIHVSLSTK